MNGLEMRRTVKKDGGRDRREMQQLKTQWSPGEIPLPEYPRPQMKRDDFEILNGWWDCTFTKSRTMPEQYDQKILVPYSPESYLSGVGRTLLPDEFLHYRRTFQIESIRPGMRLLLHFGAVDESAEVYLNHKKILEHHGGYLSFSADITDEISTGENALQLCVNDPSDSAGIARGKQKLKPGGMFYQCQSGIWQTVWMEWVPAVYIRSIRMEPDIDRECLKLQVQLNTKEYRKVRVIIPTLPVPNTFEITSGTTCIIPVPSPHLWSPEDPYLYEMKLTVGEDHVESYFAMRKFSTGKDRRGIKRFFLNNQPYFLNGVLDQGYWPEGLMTPPSDEAFVFDIQNMKDLGFNMIRKHVKIESLRWYYHCDRIGMLVWQDMVNGGKPYHALLVRDLPNVLLPTQRIVPDKLHTLFGRKSEESRQSYLCEAKETVAQLFNCVSICTWVPFNEGWGQFDAKKISEEIKKEDSTRLVDHASGWFDQGGGDFFSIHNYFFPLFVWPVKRVVALTEYGGFSMPYPGHTAMKKVYGYGIRHSRKTLTDTYARRVWCDVLPNMKRGLSAVVYTQLSDIEEEVNGLFTWDRKELKMDRKRLKKINERMFYTFRQCI